MAISERDRQPGSEICQQHLNIVGKGLRIYKHIVFEMWVISINPLLPTAEM